MWVRPDSLLTAPRASGCPYVAFPDNDQQRVQASWVSVVNMGKTPWEKPIVDAVGASVVV